MEGDGPLDDWRRRNKASTDSKLIRRVASHLGIKADDEYRYSQEVRDYMGDEVVERNRAAADSKLLEQIERRLNSGERGRE